VEDGPTFELADAAWRVSFQRAVFDPQENRHSNRGAMPLWELPPHAGGTRRALVPVLAQESLWIAWWIPAGGSVSGTRDDGGSVAIEPASEPFHGEVLVRGDLVDGTATGGRQEWSGTPAASAADLSHDHFRFEAKLDDTIIGRLGVVLATPKLYATLSGRPVPEPSSPDDAYGGWRLP
jgi:hypothetical protein